MNLGNLEVRSSKVVVLPEMSTKEKLLELGAKEYGCGMMYKDTDLGVEVIWRRILDTNEEPTNLYGWSYPAHVEKPTMH